MLLETKGPALKQEFVTADCCVERDSVRPTIRAWKNPEPSVHSPCLQSCLCVSHRLLSNKGKPWERRHFFFCFVLFFFQQLSTCQCCISPHRTCHRHSSTPAWDHWVGVSSFGRQMNLKIWSFPTGFKYKVSFCSILCVQMHFEGEKKHSVDYYFACVSFFRETATI